MRILIFTGETIVVLPVSRLKTIFIFLLVLAVSCKNQKTESYQSVPGYNFSNPVMIQLKPNLEEISGIFYYAKDTSIFAVDDEEGILYKIYVRKQVQVKQWSFSSEGDYEDILLHDSTFYALQSNGNINAFAFLSKDSLQLEQASVPIPGNNEFETLYYDAPQGKIVTICKDCEMDGKKITSAYALDPRTHTFSDTPFFQINSDDIAEELGIDKLKFRPSGAAVHPLSKDLYIISSENKLLVITNHFGKVKDVYELDRRVFKHPEGITFTPTGDLLISNEAADLAPPNILIFKYKPLLHEKS